MPNWRSTFKAKDLLSDEDVADIEAIRLAQELATRLRTSPFLRRNRYAEQFEEVRCQDDFNTALNRLYDAADSQRIWIE